jgi:predicted DNA-binding antitoxin AbrB/MazE fold protein
MTQRVRAVYRNGVFSPLGELTLPEDLEVELLVVSDEEVDQEATEDPLAGIRFSGPVDLAEHFDDYRFGRRRP